MVSNFLVWAAAHPEAVVQGVVFAVSVVMAVLKIFMTPERYAKLAPRVAGLMKIFGGVFPDLVKTSRGLKQVVTGKADVEFRAPVVEDEVKK